MGVKLVLSISIGLQFAAAFMALRLANVTGKRRAWTLIAAAIFLMALWHGFTLYQLITGDILQLPGISVELVALAVPVIMLAGIVLIRPLFGSIVRSEKFLRASEDKYRSLFDNSMDTIYISSLGGDFLDINEAGVELLGYSREELLSINVSITYANPEDRKQFVKSMKTNGFVKDYEIQLMKKDGTVIDTLITATMRRDHENRVVGFHGIIRDITRQKRAEAEQSRLFNILELSLNEIYVFDPETLRFQYVNSGALRNLGYSHDAILKMTPPSLKPEFDETSFREMMAPLLKREQEQIVFETDHLRADGSLYRCEAHLQMIELGEERVMLAVILDITKRKKAEDTLGNIARGVSALTGELFFRSLVEYLGKTLDVAYVFAGMMVDGGVAKVSTIAVYANGKIADNIEYELAGTPCENAMSEDMCCYPDSVQQKFPKDTMLVDMGVESYIGTPLYDTSGNTMGVLVVMDNKPFESLSITESMLRIFAVRASAELERVHAEDALAEEKERLAVTLHSIGDGVITTDTSGRILLINRVAEELTGWTQKEAFGKPLLEVFHIVNEFTYVPARSPVQRVLKSGRIVGLTDGNILITKDGSERIIADSGAPIRDRDSNVIGVVLVFRDITEKRKIERELLKAQKLESLGVLAGGIAHDFNNLLTAIMGNISLAKLDINEGTEPYKILEESENAALRARDITQQLLTFSKGGEPVKEIGNISELLRSTVNFAMRGSSSRREMEIAEGMPLLEIDVGQISQVINNLVINAGQAMPEGGVIKIRAESVTISAKDELSLAEGKYIKISVQDEGVGISEDNIGRIFDPFFTDKEKGSGLGLAMSYSIVSKHGGLINVKSRPGDGATFCVYLPVSGKLLHFEQKQLEVVHGRGRILLMDDEDSVRKVAERLLKKLGYAPSVVKNGDEAIKSYKEAIDSGSSFDAVILDLTIPGSMGGLKALEELKKLNPDIKALVSSGYSTDPVLADCLKHGFRGVITKPYQIEQFSFVLNSIVTEAL